MKKILIVLLSMFILIGCSSGNDDRDDELDEIIIYDYSSVTVSQQYHINKYLSDIGKDYKVKYVSILDELLLNEVSNDNEKSELSNNILDLWTKLENSTNAPHLISANQITYNGDFSEDYLANSGLMMDLSQIYETEKGKLIYDSFPKIVHESMMINNTPYLIPTYMMGTWDYYSEQMLSDEQYYLSINKDIVEKYGVDVSDWTYRIYEHEDEIITLMNKMSDTEVDKTMSNLLLSMNYYPYLTPVYGSGFVSSPFVIDERTKEVKLLVECDEYVKHINFINKLFSIVFLDDGIMDFGDGLFKYLCVESKDIKDDYYFIQPDYYYLDNAALRGYSIPTFNDNLDDTVDYLSLVYTDPRLAELLAYNGEDGKMDNGNSNNYLLAENDLVKDLPEDYSFDNHEKYLNDFNKSSAYNFTFTYGEYFDEMSDINLLHNKYLVIYKIDDLQKYMFDIQGYKEEMDIELLYEIRNYLNVQLQEHLNREK